MLTTTVIRTRRAPSPQIRARNTTLDGAANGSAGINSAPNVDAGINGATHLGGQRCGDHDDRGHSTNHRKLARHNLSLWLLMHDDMPTIRPKISTDDNILRRNMVDNTPHRCRDY